MKNIFTLSFIPTEGDCTPEQRLSLPLLVSKLMETAAGHAGVLNFGYERLNGTSLRWVVSRVTVEMERYPRINEECAITSWVGGYNRHFSQRNFEISASGEVIGYASSVWLLIDTRTRAAHDISQLSCMADCVVERDCPIEPQSRLQPVRDGVKEPYTFRYVDIDSNRHVNSSRYIELLMNHWSLDHYDTHYISRFELAYMKECLYGMQVTVNFDDRDPLDCRAEIEAGGVSHCRARIVFKERDYSRDIEEKLKRL